MPHSNTIEVRDLREEEWVWTSKSFLFHKDVDEKMYKTYCGLAAYANNVSQEAYPSIATLSSRLHMGRSTIMRALGKLEELGFIGVDRTLGEHNIYALLKAQEVGVKTVKQKDEDETPKQNTREFFQGVRDLRDKTDTSEATKVRALLLAFKEKYPNAPKDVMWNEIKMFERYWTERNSTGTKERWETEKTFEVDRRLSVWFSKKKQFESRAVITRPVRRIV
jgi:DNA-binding PadR family transcriptional regulator